MSVDANRGIRSVSPVFSTWCPKVRGAMPTSPALKSAVRAFPPLNRSSKSKCPEDLRTSGRDGSNLSDADTGRRPSLRVPQDRLEYLQLAGPRDLPVVRLELLPFGDTIGHDQMLGRQRSPIVEMLLAPDL